ncbi:MAG: 7-cyano-7-deazaguanine synthase QueC [Proteobacteria bacterium]|nr:7-cyano-7-deazaguanine synthase QueC [Pseudomonadota bacterium]
MKKGVILLSGGVDSSTTLAIAKSQGFECYAITFQYGQRNHFELEMAKRQCVLQGVKEHKIFNIDIAQFKGSALTDHTLDIPKQASTDIPITYVPARNTIFLSIALGWAEVLGAHDIFIGANIVDYSNYPDCRPEYIDAFQTMANLATRSGVEGNHLMIHRPLIQFSKTQIIEQGIALGVDYSLTLSCYNPDSQGRACKVCDPCRFRAKGFREAQIEDPTIYTAN